MMFAVAKLRQYKERAYPTFPYWGKSFNNEFLVDTT